MFSLRFLSKHLSARAMSSSSSTTHLERTSHVIRASQAVVDAVVTKISNISPTVKFLKLNIKDESVSFKPGQWVDFHIPGLSTFSGFSMCSAPSLLTEKRELHLAVKYSDYPPAHWVHTKCVDGSEVKVKVGGNVYHDAFEELEHKEPQDFLLIAGGVGINPLYSMFLNIHEASTKLPNTSKISTTLLYSAPSKEELIFKKQIDSIISEDSDHFRASYFVTKDQEGETDNSITYNRITKADIQRMLKGGADDHKRLVSYLCGPSPMMSQMKKYLTEIGLEEKNIRYESWW
ncbi:oxidoreductase NAD-binding domain-containing protein 1-like isoform X2 [Clytia hemisphaerica]|uniref:oxidoreductase NAD-binding domain-containing protein 1-like isoform X2 n=1 Tax=Clytia hemisphaerica TaxID=252671 RepID=UPI0034D43166